jgi:hypothetical protein
VLHLDPATLLDEVEVPAGLEVNKSVGAQQRRSPRRRRGRRSKGSERQVA